MTHHSLGTSILIIFKTAMLYSLLKLFALASLLFFCLGLVATFSGVGQR